MSGAFDRDRFPHLSLLASAGSGKTYQLTNRYLALAAAQAPVSTVLASTFTRLAAGEIRDRIFARLVDAADDRGKREELAAAIGHPLPGREDVLDLIRLLLQSLHRMQIRTLDGFFASVVRSFSIELGIPPGSEVVDEDRARQMRYESIRLMLDEQDPQRLVNLLRLLTQGKSDRSIMNVIDNAVKNLYGVYREALPAAWECIPRRKTLSKSEVVDAIDALEAAEPTNDKRHIKAHRDACGRARARDWDRFIGSGIAAVLIRGQTTYYSKEIERNTIAAYEPLLNHARAELANRLGDQTRATRDLLELYDAHARAVKRRQHALTFDDITAAMVDARKLGSFTEICFRLDARIQHLLLDEFQDTSIQQWRALEPIAQEIVSDWSQPRTFFCVGDMKQSIYGWRDAAPEVLDEIPRLLVGPDGTGAVREDRLSDSYRSSQIIIDTVNRVFETIDQNAVLQDTPEGAAQWLRGFQTHRTKRTELGGYAELRTVRVADEGEKGSVVRLQAAAELVADLHRRTPDRDIAVLTRTNDAVSRLLYEFSPGRLNITASGQGGGALTDAPAVNAVLDLLRLADHPDDTVAAFNVAGGPLGEILDFTEARSAARRHGLARSVRRALANLGYARTIGNWAVRLAPACDERQYRRLLQLVELAGDFDARATLRTRDFIRFVEEKKVPDPVPAPVQVMTIHKAKGLEFDIVVLPELGGKLKRSGEVAFERESKTGPITRVCMWVNEKTRALLPTIEPLFEQYHTRELREQICLLYVAVTRAKQGLYMLIDPPTPKEMNLPKQPAGILRAALSGDAKPPPDTILFEHGDPSWMDEAGPAKPSVPDEVPVPEIRLAPSTGDQHRGSAVTAASGVSSERADLTQLLRLADEEARDRGRAIHGLFEELTWIEDWSAEDGLLLDVVRRVAPRRDTSWARGILDRFHRSLTHAAVRNALSRPDAVPEHVRLWRERPFVRIIDGAVQQGIIDRLVATYGDDGAAVGAQIIDFKTDEIDAEAATTHAEVYRGQLETYRDAVVRMLRLDPACVDLTVLFVHPGAAIRLS